MSVHINSITSKASKRLYFLKQLKRAGVPQNQLLHFYTAVIRPVLEYAAPVWHHLINRTQAQQLESIQQELSYRQHIARQLRTQYADGIYRLKYYTVTLKSRLRVTQGHWKRNHWIDHTRLILSRVI